MHDPDSRRPAERAEAAIDARRRARLEEIANSLHDQLPLADRQALAESFFDPVRIGDQLYPSLFHLDVCKWARKHHPTWMGGLTAPSPDARASDDESVRARLEQFEQTVRCWETRFASWLVEMASSKKGGSEKADSIAGLSADELRDVLDDMMWARAHAEAYEVPDVRAVDAAYRSGALLDRVVDDVCGDADSMGEETYEDLPMEKVSAAERFRAEVAELLELGRLARTGETMPREDWQPTSYKRPSKDEFVRRVAHEAALCYELRIEAARHG